MLRFGGLEYTIPGVHRVKFVLYLLISMRENYIKTIYFILCCAFELIVFNSNI